jgi:hypothetical protein
MMENGRERETYGLGVEFELATVRVFEGSGAAGDTVAVTMTVAVPCTDMLRPAATVREAEPVVEDVKVLLDVEGEEEVEKVDDELELDLELDELDEVVSEVALVEGEIAKLIEGLERVSIRIRLYGIPARTNERTCRGVWCQ